MRMTAARNQQPGGVDDMARVRIGPLSYGPRGQRGIHLGPFSASYNANRWNLFVGVLVVIGLVVIVVKAIWPFLLAAVVLVGVYMIATKDKRAANRAAMRQRRAEELQRWLDGPPPTLYVPPRFSEQWFATHVPRLHPGQVPVLRAEMRARGWSDRHITQRLGRYLAQNPFYDGR
jgi:hypothetical protein